MGELCEVCGGETGIRTKYNTIRGWVSIGGGGGRITTFFCLIFEFTFWPTPTPSSSPLPCIFIHRDTYNQVDKKQHTYLAVEKKDQYRYGIFDIHGNPVPHFAPYFKYKFFYCFVLIK